MATIKVYPSQVKNSIDRRILGHFVEHFPGNIPDGIFQPYSHLSDEDGFRRDVLEAMREVGVTQIRWGGNFSSHYHWMDGVGPKDLRPKKLSFAWDVVEDNQFGTVEFIKMCRKAGAEPVIGVNMGSGTAEEAMNWVEYVNGTTDSYYANLRRSHGYEEPFGVKHWCLGNEMYGTWQFGYLSAEDYAEKAVHFALAMRRVDPSIELTALGLETDPYWNIEVARRLGVEKTNVMPGDYIKYISIHYYSIGSEGAFTNSTFEQRLAISQFHHERTRMLRNAIEVATDDPGNHIKIAWDEWNVMGQPDGTEFTLEHSLWSSSVLNSFIRDSEYVVIANYTFFVNCMGPIQTTENGIVKHAEYYVFRLYGLHMGDQLLHCSVSGEESVDVDMPIDTKWQQRQLVKKNTTLKRRISYLDIAATRCSKTGDITVFITNKHPDKDYSLDLRLMECDNLNKKKRIHTIYNPDIRARNSALEPDNIGIVTSDLPDKENIVQIKAHSINAITFNDK